MKKALSYLLWGVVIIIWGFIGRSIYRHFLARKYLNKCEYYIRRANLAAITRDITNADIWHDSAVYFVNKACDELGEPHYKPKN